MSGYIGTSGVSAPSKVSEVRDTFTATQGQTVFNTTAPFMPADCLVFLNGSKLVNGVDYDSTSGNSIVLSKGVADGDIVEFIGRTGFTVANTYTKAEIDNGNVILNAIKQVDGVGSGIDADTLRGKPLESVIGIGTKNLVINGDFSVNQRGEDSYTYASDADDETSSGGYNLDRFRTGNSKAGGSFTVTQGELPNGSKSWKCTVDSPVVDLSSGDVDRYWHGLLYTFEGRHIYQTAKQGKSITISFLFNTNVAGTYPIALRNVTQPTDWDNVDYFIHEFYHPGSGVEKVVVTVPLNHDFNPSLLNDENRSIEIIIGFLGDNDSSDITETWAGGNKLTTPNCVNWGASEGNFIEIAELQVEEGEIATAFERIPYDAQLVRCMRYYEVFELNYDFYIKNHSNSYTVKFYPKRAAPTVELGVLYASSSDLEPYFEPSIHDINKNNNGRYRIYCSDTDKTAACHSKIVLDAEL